MIIDAFGRKINYLRMSVTDRCNLRCQYCMPADGVHKQRHEDVLSYEDLYRIAKVAVRAGVEKIRVTGGEPLVRKGIVDFLAELNRLPGLKKVVLTTNGVLLGEMADDLRHAGVESVNVSLDSMRPEVFAQITRRNDLARVLAGLEAAERAGFKHIKINMVVMRGVNDDEVLDFAALTIDKPYKVRFIEFMPTLQETAGQELMVPGEELIQRLANRYPLEKVARNHLDGPADYYRIKGGAGSVGLITPVSCHFCDDCNRLRVSSSGMLKSCLYDDGGVSLVPLLAGDREHELLDLIREAVRLKPRQHDLQPGGSENNYLFMSQVGG